jgi:GR25 family glycosyltransferase involved in LPS biosynthesis
MSAKISMHVINLERSTERYQSMIKQWSDIFDLQRFNAIDAKEHGISAQMAAKKSHYALLNQLKNRPEPFQIIAEDDVMKTWRFDHEWPIIESFLTTSDWDIITLDPLLQFANLNKCANLNKEKKDLFQIDQFRSMGFLIYSKKCIDQIVEESSSKEIDKIITHNKKFNKFTHKYLTVFQGQLKSIISPGTNYTQYYKNTENFLDRLMQKVN